MDKTSSKINLTLTYAQMVNLKDVLKFSVAHNFQFFQETGTETKFVIPTIRRMLDTLKDVETSITDHFAVEQQEVF